MGVIEDVIGGIVGTLSDIALSILTPILHGPAYCIGALVSAGLDVLTPLIDAINYVGSAMWALLHSTVMLMLWLPPWLYVPIAAIIILRAVMVVIAIASKIAETLVLRGWI